MASERIPGNLFRTTYFFGLTFTELATLASVPAAAVLPTLLFDFIPVLGTILLSILFGIGVVAAGIRSPPGQTPLEWTPAAVSRRLGPDTYYIDPRPRTSTTQVLDVIQTQTNERVTKSPPKIEGSPGQSGVTNPEDGGNEFVLSGGSEGERASTEEPQNNPREGVTQTHPEPSEVGDTERSKYELEREEETDSRQGMVKSND
jgi:hypothetical protein